MELIKLIQSASSPFLDNFFQAVTMLGEEYIYIILLGFVFWCIDKRYGYKLSFAFLFSSVVNGIAKSIFQAQRPLGIEGIRHLRVETATGSSFPSGHTQNITSFTVSVMKKIEKAWFYVVGSLAILLVGVSRLYLGVHWPLDVLGGIAFGIASTLLADFAFEYAERKKNKQIHLILLIPALAAAFAWSDSADLVKAVGTFCSFLIGYSIEDRFIRFETKAVCWKQIVKFVIGISIVLALKEILKRIMPETPIFEFLRYFIMGLWITVGAPYAFRFLRLIDAKADLRSQTIGM